MSQSDSSVALVCEVAGTAPLASPGIAMRIPRDECHAVFDTPQKNGIGPFTMPLTFLRHA